MAWSPRASMPMRDQGRALGGLPAAGGFAKPAVVWFQISVFCMMCYYYHSVEISGLIFLFIATGKSFAGHV